MVEVAEIKTGFKLTQAGLIPKDWVITNIGKVCEIYGRIGFRGYTKNDIVPKGSGAITLSPSNINDSQLNTSKCTYISWNKYHESPEIKIYDGDILLVKTGSTFGKTALVKNLKEKATVNPQIVVLKKVNIDNVFLSYMMGFRTVQQQINAFIVGGAIPTLSQKHVASFIIPLPPTKAEQTAIATALSDMDDLIAAQEQLIAKKRAIKQGAMQELLQPKEGWVTKAVSAIGKPFGGLSGKAKKDFEDGTSPYIPFLNVMTNPVIDTSYFDYVKIRQGEHQNQAQKGDLFFNGSSETPEEVGMCSVLLEETPNLYLNSFCFGFRFHKGVQDDGLFLAYYFRSSYGREKMYLLAQGATRFNLSKTNFLNLELELPEPEEQTRIARILSDMDTEIEQLGTQLAKYRQVKVGMMQELLTGKKRLIEAK